MVFKFNFIYISCTFLSLGTVLTSIVKIVAMFLHHNVSSTSVINSWHVTLLLLHHEKPWKEFFGYVAHNKFSVKSLKHKRWTFLSSVIFHVFVVKQNAPRHWLCWIFNQQDGHGRCTTILDHFYITHILLTGSSLIAECHFQHIISFLTIFPNFLTNFIQMCCC
jgi:hypothetical protein